MRIAIKLMLILALANILAGVANVFAAELPPETRGWATVPGVIRDDGIEEFRIEVDANGPVLGVSLEAVLTTPGGMLVPPDSLELRDDGLEGDRVAGDFVFTSGPIRYNTAVPMRSHYEDDPDSPAGLWESQVGVVHIEELDGTITRSLGNPSIGILRSDIIETQRRELTPNIAVSGHLINIRTDTRTTQRWMRQLPDSDLSALTKQVYEVLPDAFDFFMFFSTYKVERLPWLSSANFNAGVMVPVKIDYTGIGLMPRDGTADWGSAGRLLSVIGLDSYERGIHAGNATHELMHSWVTYLDDSLGLNDGGHYKVRSSAASLLGGVKWVPNADGSFAIDCDHGRNHAYRVPPLDKYMMGLIDASEVPTLYTYDESISWYDRCLTNGPILPSEIIATISIEDIQAIHGIRTPGPSSAQSDFRIAFVTESHERFLNPTELTFYEILAAHYTKTLPPEAPDPYVANNWVPITRFFGEDTTWSSDVFDMDATLDIDVKPFGRPGKPNKVNLRSRGSIWVAILSDTSPDSPFDPSSQVDIQTVEFGPDGAESNRYRVRDINKDGLGDLMLRFKIRDTGIVCGDTEATLTGETYDGQSLSGTDSIKTVCGRRTKHKGDKSSS